MKRNTAPELSPARAREAVRRLIAQHFTRPAWRIVRQSGGLSNFVFLVRLAKEDLIVRLSPEPTKITAFAKEQWAMNRARQIGVPTPQIIDVGNELVPFPYMISRRAEGREATAHSNRMQVLREMGRYAARINSIRTQGFGSTFDWSKNRAGHHHTWNDFLFHELKLSERLELLEKRRMVPPGILRKVRAALRGAADLAHRPALTHGDMRLKNIIVRDDGTISAILDWEHCLSSLAPHWELSIALHDLSIDEKQAFLEGYGLHERELLKIAPIMKALNIVNYASEVDRLAKAGDLKCLDRYRMRLKGSLDLYSL